MNEVFKETEITVEEVNTYIFSGQLKYGYLEQLCAAWIIYIVPYIYTNRKKRSVIFLHTCSNEVMLRVGYYEEVHQKID